MPSEQSEQSEQTTFYLFPTQVCGRTVYDLYRQTTDRMELLYLGYKRRSYALRRIERIRQHDERHRARDANND
jgi:hypothetical protein